MESILEEEALNPNTSANRLRELSKSFDRVIRQAVAQNPNTPPDILVRLFDKFPLQVLHNPVLNLILLEKPNFLEEIYYTYKLVFHQNKLPDFFIKWAVFNPNESIRSTVASSPKTSQNYLEHLSKDKQSFVRIQVAANYNSPVHVLEQLAQDRDKLVRESVAQNPHVSPKILEYLAQDGIVEVRREVAANYNTPAHVLEKLARDPSLIVRASCCDR